MPNDGRAAEPLPAITKSYFAINERGMREEFALVRMLVGSCLKNTSLEPVCVYTGPPSDKTAWLVDQGVRVIVHTSRLEEELNQAYGRKYRIFSGHWLRLDLPIIETECQYVLYTDIDVLFVRDPAPKLPRPPYLAVCPEHKRTDRSYFNTGVMVMNLEGLRSTDTAFLDSVRTRLRTNFTYPTHDQRSFNDFFLDKVEWMPLELNWKPYWGVNQEACIVHFHGPKPDDVADLKSGRLQDMKRSYLTIFRRNPAAYDHYAERAAEFMQ